MVEQAFNERLHVDNGLEAEEISEKHPYPPPTLQRARGVLMGEVGSPKERGGWERRCVGVQSFIGFREADGGGLKMWPLKTC